MYCVVVLKTSLQKDLVKVNLKVKSGAIGYSIITAWRDAYLSFIGLEPVGD